MAASEELFFLPPMYSLKMTVEVSPETAKHVYQTTLRHVTEDIIFDLR